MPGTPAKNFAYWPGQSRNEQYWEQCLEILPITIQHFKFAVGNAHFSAVGGAGVTGDFTGKSSMQTPVLGLIDGQR